MVVLDILIPQLGEGLQEVLIREFLKQPGDPIKRDEPIYLMETDKAVMDIESPHQGTLQEWLVQEGDIVPIGSPIARVATEATVPPVTLSPVNTNTTNSLSTQEIPQNCAGLSEVMIPPRTRAYCRELSITQEEMRQIPAPTGKLMPKDVDDYLALKARAIEEIVQEEVATGYSDRPISNQQRTLIYRLKRSAQLVVPGTIARSVEWKGIQHVVQTLQQRNSASFCSEFQVFAYCVAQASKQHLKFRSTLIGENTIREYDHLNMGIAVPRPNDELVTAVIPNADTLDFLSLVRAIKSQIRHAYKHGDQATETTQLLLSYLGSYEITEATPALVAPAVAVLFIGASYKQDDKLVVNLALTFDHRLINGVGAANFLNEIAQQVQHIEKILDA